MRLHATRFLTLLFSAMILCQAFAQEAPAPPPAPVGGLPPAPEANEEPLFKVPEGTDENDMLLFLKRMARAEPTDRSEPGILRFLKEMDEAAAEVSKREVSDQVAEIAYSIRLQVLGMMPQFGDTLAMIRRTQLIDELKKSDRPAIRELVEEILIDERISRVLVLEAPAKVKLIEDLAKMVKDAPFEDEDGFPWQLESALMLAQNLERVGDDEHAKIAYQQLLASLEGKTHPQLRVELKDVVNTIQARVRRMDLPGKPIEIVGPTITGEQYNIAEYKGKVVLVDFWATWCPSCIQEIPNITRLYDLYHDKGFEVVGVNLDEDELSLRQFLRVNHLKWPTIYFPNGENELADKYGISVLPQTFLVDKEGNVVAVQVMGRELAEQLETLLGPVDETKSPAPPEPN